MSDIVSRPYRPDPAHCCERCVFGTGEHSEYPNCEAKVEVPCALCEKPMKIFRAHLGYYNDCGMQCGCGSKGIKRPVGGGMPSVECVEFRRGRR